MIKDQFMLTDTTVNGFEITKPFPTSSNPELVGDDPAKPYYMGYVKDEDISASFKFSNWVYDEDAGEIRVTQINENRPWGFVGETSGGYFYGASIADDGNGNWVNMPNSGNRKPYSFINKGVMARPIFDPNLTLSYAYVEKNGTYTWRTGSGFLTGQITGKKYRDLLEFIQGNQTWSLSTFWGTLVLSYSDFSEYGWAEVTDSANHTIYLWFYSCTFTSGACNIGGNSGLRIVPFFRTTMPNGKYAYIVPDCRCPVGGGNDAAVSINVNAASGWKISSMYYYYDNQPLGLPPTTVRTDLIINTCNPSQNIGLVHEKYFWSGSGSYYGALVVTFTLKDFANWLGNFNKFAKVGAWQQNTDTYTNDTFVNLYNTDNTPKYNISTLPFGSALDKILQPWQKPAYDISEDDFNADTDLPGGGSSRPDPDLPDLPGDEEHGGDNIEPNNTNGIGGGFGFMTQYALRASDLQELGRKLWAGFDPDNPDIDSYLSNFIYKISTTTGSVNFADIMDFFVSLRFYPFPLGNISTITTSGHDMYIGAGTEPLAFANNIHTMDSFEGIVNAGELSVPFWYGDFRDYQTQITLYLPYCGTAELNPVDVMGSTLECFYEVDFCTGSCTGYVWCTTWDGARYCVASLPGQLGADVPMSASNAGRVASRIMGDRITFTENLVSILRHGAGFAGAAASGNVGSAIDRAFSAFITPTIAEEKRLNDELGKGAISAPVLGSGGGFAAYKNPSTAYIQVRSAFYPDITNYPDTVGNPASETVTIRDCSGFCRFVNVDVTSITADIREQTAIRQALENGVIL